VALNRKSEARKTIVEALQTLDFGRSERLVRINAVGSGLEELDLSAVLPSRPDGIVIPKVDQAAQVVWIDRQIEDYEASRGWPKGGLGLLVVVESARGIVNLAEIAGSTARLQAIIFGAEDFAGDIGATRSAQGWEVFYARSALVTYASAFNLQAIDMVYTDFKDVEGLFRESLAGAGMAFSGKQIIHPNQVEPVQRAFTPSDAEIASARRVMSAYEAHQAAGKGAFALDGKMIDAPIIKTTERVLERARAAGKL
jgi:citrate lyase beta subunit